MTSEGPDATNPKSKNTLLKVAAISVTIIVVVGLVLALYISSLRFGGCCGTPGINVLRKSNIENGFKIEFTAPTREVLWNDLTIDLTAGTDIVAWTNISTKVLTNAHYPEVWHYGSALALGGLLVFLNVTDVSANGRMSTGDYITLTTGGGLFSTSTIYSLVLIWEPTSGSMLNYDFTG